MGRKPHRFRSPYQRLAALPTKQQIVAWARQRLRENDWVLLDTETTGLSHTDEVVEIAIITNTGEVLLQTLIRPYRGYVPGDATRIHGITYGQTYNAPWFCDLYPHFIRGRATLMRAFTTVHLVLILGMHSFRVKNSDLFAI